MGEASAGAPARPAASANGDAPPPGSSGRPPRPPSAPSPAVPRANKKTYTFGMYKAAKIALGLKRRSPSGAPSGAVPGAGGSPATPDGWGGAGPAGPKTLAPLAVPSGPWHEVDAATEWTGPPVPVRGPDVHEEPFMIAAPKTVFEGHALMPWEGVECVGPEVVRALRAGLRDFRVDPAAGRPDTRHPSMPHETRMLHMRRACADVLPAPLFSFALKFFEGPDSDPGEACERFLSRILKGCGHAVYSSIAVDDPETNPKAFEKISDSALAGAALFLRVFLIRFAKRFPQQHGFVHPSLDAPAEREALVARVGDGFQSWEFMRATDAHPAAIVVRMTNKGVKSLVRCPKPDSWVAINHFYEFCIAQPSRELSGHPSVFVIDLGKLSLSVLMSESNIRAIAGQLQAAMFHPEPFSAFVVAHTPSIFSFVWGIAKLFLTESARDKFVILSGSASTHFRKKLNIDPARLPEAIGGTSATETLLSVQELLRLEPTQQRAVDAYVAAHGEDVAAHRAETMRRSASGGSELFRDQSGASTPGGGGGGGGGGRGGSTQLSGKRESVKDLRRRIAALEGKLDGAAVRAGGDLERAGSAARRAAGKLREMKRRLRAMQTAKIVLVLAAAALALAAITWAFFVEG